MDRAERLQGLHAKLAGRSAPQLSLLASQEPQLLLAPEFSRTTIVLIGNFVPTTFTPLWLATKGLIAESEADSATIEVIHPSLASFSLEWGLIKVQENLFLIESSQAPWVRIQDLVCNLFTQHLPETRLRLMGINREVEFPASSARKRDEVGARLAPLEAWGEWGEVLSEHFGSEHNTGVTTLTMRQGAGLTDRPAGYIDAQVGPAVRSPQIGIRVFVNDHYDASGEEEATRLQFLMTILRDNFEASIKRSELIIDQIMKISK